MEVLNDLIPGESGYNILSQKEFYDLILHLVETLSLDFVGFKDGVLTLRINNQIYNIKKT